VKRKGGVAVATQPPALCCGFFADQKARPASLTGEGGALLLFPLIATATPLSAQTRPILLKPKNFFKGLKRGGSKHKFFHVG